MKKLAIAMLCAATFATMSSAELVENGNFAAGVSYWRVGVANDYGKPDPVLRVGEGALEAAQLHSTSPGYLNIEQAVNIRKGQRYKLSYDVKGEGEGRYVVSIQHVHHGRQFVKRAELPGPSWETVEAEFEGSFDTDEQWFRKWRSAARSNKLEDRGTPNKKLREIEPVPHGDPPSRSSLIFSIGELSGSFAVRNVSIVEVE